MYSHTSEIIPYLMHALEQQHQQQQLQLAAGCKRICSHHMNASETITSRSTCRFAGELIEKFDSAKSREKFYANLIATQLRGIVTEIIFVKYLIIKTTKFEACKRARSVGGRYPLPTARPTFTALYTIYVILWMYSAAAAADNLFDTTTLGARPRVASARAQWEHEHEAVFG